MKITKRMLKQLIKEELENVMQEAPRDKRGKRLPAEGSGFTSVGRQLTDPTYRPGSVAWEDAQKYEDEYATLSQAREDAARREGWFGDDLIRHGNVNPGTASDDDTVDHIRSGPAGTLEKFKHKRRMVKKQLDGIDQQIAQLQGMIDRT